MKLKEGACVGTGNLPGAWHKSYSYGPWTFATVVTPGDFASALSNVHRMVATVLDGINLSPQVRTARESHRPSRPSLAAAWGSALTVVGAGERSPQATDVS